MDKEQVIIGYVPSKANSYRERTSQQRITDDVLISSYERTGNVWKTGKEVGICGQAVWERLHKLGICKGINYWSEEDDKVLIEKYNQYKSQYKLDVLAAELGRTKQFICRKAKALGLTNKKDKKMPEDIRIRLSEIMTKWISENGHPRGALGYRHTESDIRKMSDAQTRSWKNPKCIRNSEEYRQMLSDRLHNSKMLGVMNVFSNRGKHPITLGGVDFVFKSTWEVEVAKRLESLKSEKLIAGWDYEKVHFEFKDVSRLFRSYCPDFDVYFSNGDVLYIEVKGWKMESSMKRISMFRERYPFEKYFLLDKQEYRKVLNEDGYLKNKILSYGRN